MTFQFDTSGVVERTGPGWLCSIATRWSDLSPFVQGCGQAMARALYERLVAEGMDPTAAQEAVAFRNWAPETLARIMEDCARFLAILTDMDANSVQANPAAGADLWATRNGAPDFLNGWPQPYAYYLHHAAKVFPPLTPYLGEDGKVYLREGV